VVWAVVWWRGLPVPGYAIGVLALLAAVMSVHIEVGMAWWQKALWMLLMGGFLFLEFRAINKDREDYTAAEKARRDEERKQFQGIADGISVTIENSNRQFAETMSGIKQNINTITGGKSFCYLMFADNGTLPTFVHSGNYPLTGVSVRIVDMQKWNQMIAKNPHPSMQEFRSADTYVELGDLPVHTALQRGTIQLAGQSQSSFNIFYSARNGFWTQELRLQLVGGKWLTATRVTRTELGSKQKTPEKLFERIDKDFPRNSKGEIDWQ
jgi:hypothetical protein